MLNRNTQYDAHVERTCKQDCCDDGSIVFCVQLVLMPFLVRWTDKIGCSFLT